MTYCHFKKTITLLLLSLISKHQNLKIDHSNPLKLHYGRDEHLFHGHHGIDKDAISAIRIQFSFLLLLLLYFWWGKCLLVQFN